MYAPVFSIQRCKQGIFAVLFTFQKLLPQRYAQLVSTLANVDMYSGHFILRMTAPIERKNKYQDKKHLYQVELAVILFKCTVKDIKNFY